MSVKNATYISLLIFMVLGIGYYWIASSFPENNTTKAMGADFYPKLLAILLLILCVISWIENRKKKNSPTVNIPHLKLIGLTIGNTVLYFILWINLGYFYFFTFIYLVSLFTIFHPVFQLKKLTKDIIIALLVTIIVYLLFELLMGVNFSL
jgi:putative tricarboxylic transport membrane protein